jgi:hypothetical protein
LLGWHCRLLMYGQLLGILVCILWVEQYTDLPASQTVSAQSLALRSAHWLVSVTLPLFWLLGHINGAACPM